MTTKSSRRVAPWGNRIVKTGSVKAGELLANENNWRIHPKPQQDILSQVLTDIGFVQSVVVNLRTGKEWGRNRNVETMIDGHARVELSLSRGEDTDVPVSYVDLSPEEEASILATFDPIGSMAVPDREKLDALVAQMPDDLRDLTEILRLEKKAAHRVVTFDATEHYRIVIDCESANQQQELLQRLCAEGYTCRPD